MDVALQALPAHQHGSGTASSRECEMGWLHRQIVQAFSQKGQNGQPCLLNSRLYDRSLQIQRDGRLSEFVGHFRQTQTETRHAAKQRPHHRGTGEIFFHGAVQDCPFKWR